MPRRRLLSPTQYALLMEIPADQRLMVRYYTLTDRDKRIVSRHRGSCNRLGVALQLAYLRYPGCVMPAPSKGPDHLRAFIAQQLGFEDDDLDGYGHREMSRLNHLAKLCDEYGYKALDHSERKALSEWLLPIAIKSDHGLHLATALLEEMRRRKLIVPAVDVTPGESLNMAVLAAQGSTAGQC